MKELNIRLSGVFTSRQHDLSTLGRRWRGAGFEVTVPSAFPGPFTPTEDRASPRSRPSAVPPGVAWSGRCGPDRDGDPSPCVLPRIRRWEVEHESANRDHDSRSDLEKLLAKLAHLAAGELRPGRSETELLEEHVRRRRDQHPELVGDERRATGPSQVEVVVQLLDPVFRLSPPTVELVDEIGPLPEVCDHEARIVPGLPCRMDGDLRLHHDATLLLLPRACGIAEGAEVPGHESRLLVLRTGLGHGRIGQAEEPLVLPDPHDVLHLEVFEDAESIGSGEAAVETDDDLGLREGLPQLGHHPAQDSQAHSSRSGEPGSETREEEVLVGLVVEGEEAQDRQEAVGVVVPVEEGESLLAVGGIVGGVEVDDDLVGLPAESRPVVLDNEVLEVPEHPDDVSCGDGALEAGERGLGAEIGISDGVSPAGLLEDGITGGPLGVVAVPVSGGQREDPLAEEIQPGMDDLSGLPIVGNVARQALRQPNAPVECGEQGKAAVGALEGLIEGNVCRTAEEVFEENSLSVRIHHWACLSHRSIGLSTNRLTTIVATPFSIQGVIRE